MNPLRTIAPLVLVSSILGAATAPTRVSASCAEGTTAAYFNLHSTYDIGACAMFLGGPIPTVSVTAVPFRRARLSLPNPPWGTVVGESWNFPFTGDRVTGMEFDLGNCFPPGGVLGVLTIFVDPGTNAACTPWKIDDGAEIEDCDGVTRAGVSPPNHITTVAMECECCFQCCQGLPPYGLFPTDGAAAVPVNVELSWSGVPDGLDPSIHSCWVRIGTDPDCATAQMLLVDCDVESFSPDFLQPETTYYWQVGWNASTGSGCSAGAMGEAPIQSFTTEDVLPVTPATWGKIKAMYHD
jgi:hypothetical protein